MRRLSCIALLAFGCSDGSNTSDAGGGGDGDASNGNCLPQGVQGVFAKRSGNPRMLPAQTFSDGKIDLSITDPDVRWNAGAARYELYYGAAHATSPTSGDDAPVIRRAISPDRNTWTVDDAPVLVASTDMAAWDRTHVAMPSIAFNPDAPAGRQYLMMYAGASRAFPYPGYTTPEFAIGAAFSADGTSFTRITAAQSTHGKDGLAVTGAQIHPGGTAAIVFDPEVVYANGSYHLWMASLHCGGASCENLIAYGISYATSPDGIAWTRREAPVLSLLRASADNKTGGRAPSVIYDTLHCRWEMWLTNDLPGDTASQPVVLDNMLGVFHADSTDGLYWNMNYTRARDVAWTTNPAAPGETLGLAAGADIAQNATGRLMLYVGFDDQNVPAGFTLPTATGTTSGVMTLNVATRDLP
jgi:hypothetical protein